MAGVLRERATKGKGICRSGPKARVLFSFFQRQCRKPTGASGRRTGKSIRACDCRRRAGANEDHDSEDEEREFQLPANAHIASKIFPICSLPAMRLCAAAASANGYIRSTTGLLLTA